MNVDMTSVQMKFRRSFMNVVTASANEMLRQLYDKDECGTNEVLTLLHDKVECWHGFNTRTDTGTASW